jgi:hypothetical protein
MRLPFLFFAIAGCGGSIAGAGPFDASSDAEPDAGTPDAATPVPGATPDASTPALVHCPWEHGGPDGGKVAYDKDCVRDVDCAIGMHLNNCCGQEIALGVNASDRWIFTQDGGICGDEFGGLCDCAIGGTIAEDGRTSMKPGGGDIVVACVSGRCVTHVAP